MDYLKLKPLVTSGYLYDRYEIYLQEMKDRAILNLISACDPVEVHRHQGHISCLDHLLNLKSKIINDVSNKNNK